MDSRVPIGNSERIEPPPDQMCVFVLADEIFKKSWTIIQVKGFDLHLKRVKNSPWWPITLGVVCLL